MDADNPLFTTSDAEADLGYSDISVVRIHNIVVVDGEYCFYGSMKRENHQQELFCTSGSSWTDISVRNIIFAFDNLDIEGPQLYNPTVAKALGTQLIMFDVGKQGDLWYDSRVYAATGGPYEFDLDTDYVVIPSGELGD